MKKKILHVLNSSNYSGAENVVITTINMMKSDVQCAYVSQEGPIRKVLEANQIPFFSFPKISVVRVRRIIQQFQPDIIHAHDYTASIICALTGIRKPIISHLHNNAPWIKTCHPYSLMYLFSCSRYKSVLAVSKAIFQEYVFGKLIEKKSMVVSNPIDISMIQKKALIGKGDMVPDCDMVFIGRLAPPKNIFRFINIVGVLVKDFPDLKVCLIGDGELKDECVTQLNRLGLRDTIRLMGYVENPYRILSKAKVLCMTSEWEGFGLVAVEALALSVPVVATPVGGLPGIVDDRCGKLCRTDDEFVQQIKKLFTDERYWQMKSQGAAQRALELNNIQEYTNRLRWIYQNIS